MWIVSGTYGMAITFESKAGFSIGNDLSWRHSCATTGDANTMRCVCGNVNDAMLFIRKTKEKSRMGITNVLSKG
jgi:hypothetical protein